MIFVKTISSEIFFSKILYYKWSCPNGCPGMKLFFRSLEVGGRTTVQGSGLPLSWLIFVLFFVTLFSSEIFLKTLFVIRFSEIRATVWISSNAKDLPLKTFRLILTLHLYSYHPFFHTIMHKMSTVRPSEIEKPGIFHLQKCLGYPGYQTTYTFGQNCGRYAW